MKRISFQQHTNLLIKLVILALLIWVIYLHIIKQGQFNDLYTIFCTQWKSDNGLYLLVVIILMPVNWLLESYKWKIVMCHFIPMTIGNAAISVLSGISLGLVTPHNIGVYGGRILILEAKDNWKGVIATVVGGLAQNVVIVSFGLLAMALYFFVLDYEIASYASLMFGLSFIILIILVITFVYLNKVSAFLHRVIKWKLINNYLDKLSLLNQISIKTNIYVLCFSFMRYMIYMGQYYLLLRYFGLEIDFIFGFSGIGLIFLIQTGIPLPPLLGIVARGEMALLVWGVNVDNTLGILAATFSLWIINLLIPAFVGLVFVLKTNILKSLGFVVENH